MLFFFLPQSEWEIVSIYHAHMFTTRIVHRERRVLAAIGDRFRTIITSEFRLSIGACIGHVLVRWGLLLLVTYCLFVLLIVVLCPGSLMSGWSYVRSPFLAILYIFHAIFMVHMHEQ